MKNLFIFCGLQLLIIPCEAAESSCLAKPRSEETTAQDTKLESLFKVIRFGNMSEDDLLNKVDELLSQGCDVNQVGYLDRTLLMFAAARDYRAVVQKLIDAGADLKIRDKGGMNALMFGAYQGHAEICTLLIGHMGRISIDAPDNSETTALMYAARSGSKATISLLLQHGAQTNARNKSGSTPLMQACGASFPSVEVSWRSSSQKGKIKTLAEARTAGIDACTELLQSGADMGAVDASGRSALFYAALNLREDVCKLLLSRGATSIRIVEPDNLLYVNDLMSAALLGNETCLKVLLDAGVPVNAKNDHGETALLKAASRGHLPCISCLLTAKADIELCDDTGLTPLYAAAQEDQKQAVATLLKAGARRTLDPRFQHINSRFSW